MTRVAMDVLEQSICGVSPRALWAWHPVLQLSHLAGIYLVLEGFLHWLPELLHQFATSPAILNTDIFFTYTLAFGVVSFIALCIRQGWDEIDPLARKGRHIKLIINLYFWRIISQDLWDAEGPNVWEREHICINGNIFVVLSLE